MLGTHAQTGWLCPEHPQPGDAAMGFYAQGKLICFSTLGWSKEGVPLPSKSCLLRNFMNSCSPLPRQISLCHTACLADILFSSVLESINKCHSLNQNLISHRLGKSQNKSSTIGLVNLLPLHATLKSMKLKSYWPALFLQYYRANPRFLN